MSVATKTKYLIIGNSAGGVGAAELDGQDSAVLKDYVSRFADLFGYETDAILKRDFIKLYPRFLRPYGRLYAC